MNIKQIAIYTAVAVAGIAVGAGSAGADSKKETVTVTKEVTVDPTAERVAELDRRQADLDKRQADLDALATQLDGREAAVSKAEAAKKASTFGDGVHQVGVDIVAGTYRTDGGSGCYWEKSTGSSGLDGIIDNDNVSGPTVVVIEPSVKLFKSARCGTWTKR